VLFVLGSIGPGEIRMAQPYKPGSQVRYIVGRMPDSGKHLLEAVNKLSEKLDSYDRRITSLELDLSKVQSQVDLSMKSIQVLQKEVAKFHRGGGGINPLISRTTSGVIGSSPTGEGINTALPLSS
jgi:hypothetical protein